MNIREIVTAPCATFCLALAMSFVAVPPVSSHGQAAKEVVAAQVSIRESYDRHDKAAASARKAGDWATVRRHAAAVDTLLNGNPSALMVVARAAARLGDSTAAIDLVRTVMSMGVMRNLSGDQDLAPLHASPEWPTLVAKNEANARAIGSPRTIFALPAIDFIAEDIVWDSERDRFLVSSVRKGTIVAVKRNGTSASFIARDAAKLWGVFALAIDGARSRLWATTVAMPHVEGVAAADSGKSAVVRFDLRTGAVEKRYGLRPTARGNSPGDIAIAPNGDLYVSDSRSGVVYAIRVAVDSLEVLVPEGTFMSPQGPALSGDGRTLYVADYIRGLAQVNLASGAMSWLRHDRNVALNGIDGLTLAAPNTLIAVQNGVVPNRVMALTLDPTTGTVTGARVLAQDTTSIREPTHGLILDDEFHFIANSGWDGFGDDGSLLKDHRLTAPAVLSIRLRF